MNRLRAWLIRKLAGTNPVMLNMRGTGEGIRFDVSGPLPIVQGNRIENCAPAALTEPSPKR